MTVETAVKGNFRKKLGKAPKTAGGRKSHRRKQENNEYLL